MISLSHRVAACLVLYNILIIPGYSADSGCGLPKGNPNGNYVIPGVMGNIAYRDDLTLDAYAPAGEPRPAAVIIHGASGNKTTHVTQLFDVLTRAGYAWFSIDYRTAADVSEGIRYIRCPGRFNITDRTILIGADTGAQIALDVAALGGFQGVVTFGGKFSEVTAPSGPRDAGLKSGVTSPVIMFHGTNDDQSPLSQAEAICKKMNRCTLNRVQDGIHDFENWHPDQWQWKEELAAWLRNDRRGLWKDIAYSRPDGRELLMDAFIPQGPGPFAAVIIAHGGGWEAGDKVTYVSPVFEPLADAGFAWFSIDYRLTPFVHVAQQLDDLRAAVRYIREHATRFHVDPSRIALLGESASGHLVAQVASQPCPGCEVQAVVSFYGVYNFTKWASDPEWKDALKRIFGDPAPEILKQYSPIFGASSSLPPMLLIQGTKDELFEGTREYATRLKEVHARHELVLVDGAPHGMENWEGHPEWMFYKQKMVEWLKETMGGQ